MPDKLNMKKMRILIADNVELHHDLIEIIIEGHYSIEVIHAFNTDEATKIISNSPKFDLIFLNYTLPLKGSSEVINVNKSFLNCPVCLVGKGSKEDYTDLETFFEMNKLNSFIGFPFTEEGILKVAFKILIENKQHITHDDFIKLKLRHYIKYNQFSSDVYIKIHEGKLTKITEIEDKKLSDKDLLEHYLSKKIEDVFITKDHYQKTVEDCILRLKSEIKNNSHPVNLIKIAGLNFHISLSGLESIGISQFQFDKMSEIIEELITEISKYPLADLDLKKIVHEEGFLAGHSILLMLIAGSICKETQLPFEQTMKKLCLAAFFHDFSILNFGDPELEMKIYEIEDERLLQKMLDHPLQSAKLVPNIQDLLDDVKRIIAEHHEMPMGDGYPRKLNSNQISGLSALFIISHHITLCLMRNDYDKDRLKNFIKNNEIVFKHGNFSKFYSIAMKKFS